MTEPAVFARARILREFNAGAIFEVAVLASDAEAFEVLDYLEHAATAKDFDLAALSAGIEEARMASDPWLVLEHILIEGVPMVRKLELN